MQSLHTHDGLPLHLRRWSAAQPAHGLVLIVHGLGEHIGRYDGLAQALNSWGWHVAGFDLRGHGASGGKRGCIARDDSLLRDLGRVIDALRESWAGRLVLLGHSLGGLIAARYVAEGLSARPFGDFRPADALVLSSPALDAGLSGGQKALLAVLGRLAPGLAVSNGLQPGWISRDEAVVQAYIDDPLVHGRIAPRLARFIVEAGRHVRACAPSWRLPTLLLYAGDDRCVAAAGSAAFASAAPPALVQARAFDGRHHEIFNEPERDTVLAALQAWLDTQAG